MGRTVEKKRVKVDLVMIFMVGAMMLAVGCSWILRAASGGQIREAYDDPLHRESAPLHHTTAATHPSHETHLHD